MPCRSDLVGAYVYVENNTSCHFTFHVQHQYTDNAIENSSHVTLAPGERSFMMTAHYRYGWGTTGRDNWKITGVQLHKVQGNAKGSIINFKGEAFIEGMTWKSWHGFAAEWKIHTLREEDEDKNTVIHVYPSMIEFDSCSGKSTTRWDDPVSSIARIM